MVKRARSVGIMIMEVGELQRATYPQDKEDQ